MPVEPEDLVEKTMAPLEELGIPEQLQRSLASHQANLVTLAKNLLDGGQSEDMVQQTLEAVFAAYRAELAKTIMSLREHP